MPFSAAPISGRPQTDLPSRVTPIGFNAKIPARVARGALCQTTHRIVFASLSSRRGARPHGIFWALSPRLFHLFPTFAVGGSQVRLAQIANHFGDRYRHTIFATDGVYDAQALIGPHVPFTRFEASIDKRRGLRNVPLYRRIINEVQPDVVVTHNWGTIEWAFATRFAAARRHVHIE